MTLGLYALMVFIAVAGASAAISTSVAIAIGGSLTWAFCFFNDRQHSAAA